MMIVMSLIPRHKLLRCDDRFFPPLNCGDRVGDVTDFVLGSFKLNSEGSATSASFTRRINFAAMALDHCFGDRQSQTQTSPRPPRALLKHFKYFRQKVGFNSFPAVCDLKRYLFFALIKGPNGNCPAFGRELLSIF